jgi:glycosyltransferase involved in cell wall biosynthesis
VNQYAILHIDLGRTFRGGQRQTYNLIRFLKENGIDTGCVVVSESELGIRLSEIGVPIYPISYGGFDIVAESIRLRKVCSEMGYSMIHAHDSHGHNIALTLKFLNPALRVIVTRRVLSGKSKALISRWKYTSRNTDLFIAVSSVVEDELLHWGVSDGRVVHIPSGVDTKYFTLVDADEFKKRNSIPDRKFYIGTACALDENKDVATLINMAGKLSYKHDDFILLVAGTGEGRDGLQRLARFIEAEDKIRLLGQVSEMPQFYSLLDVYVLSSRAEGLGTSLLEAGACGCAIVASDCGGPRDFIDDGRTGFLFPVEDDEKLFRIVNELIENNDRRESVAKSFEKTLDQYEIDQVCRQVVTQYNRLAMLTG